jgi:8-oxo-dGTP pyrophosphatase MutT (NUDIX family)
MTSRPKQVSCGVIVTDGLHLLLGHAFRSPRWDIPKGLAEPGEALRDAAVRELKEETGLAVLPSRLRSIGTHEYLRDKDLALFVWRLAELPAPEQLRCASLIDRPGYPSVPELDRFGIFPFETARSMVGKNLARLLNQLRPQITGE